MFKRILFAASLAVIPAAAMAQNQGNPNGLPEPPSIRNEMAPRFQQYVIRQQPRSFTYDQPVVVGTMLPQQGISYYEVPQEYGVSGYRYTVVNNRTVLVDPQTRRIVQVIE